MAAPVPQQASMTLEGGFWSFVTGVPTPGAPELSIFLTATNTFVISWPVPADGYVLEQNSWLERRTTWTQLQPPYQTNTTHAWVTVPFTTAKRFFRLRK